MAQLLDRLDDRFALLTAGDRLAAGRHRSLAATVEWSYQLLDEHERRVFRAVSVFPGPFTLEAAEAVAGAGAGPAVLRLVDCSLLVPPRAGPGWPVPVRDAGDAARLRGRAAGRGRGAGRGRRRAGRVRAGGGRAGRGGAADQRRGGGRRAVAGCRGCHHAAGAGLGDGARSGRRAAAGGRAGLVVAPAGPAGRCSTRCCARPPGAPSRAATGGAPRSSGSAGRRCSRPIWPGRWAISPRCGTRSAGRGPSRALADGLAGRAVALRQHGPARRGGRGCPPRAGRGPGDRLPGRGGAGPGRAQPRRSVRRRPGRARCGWPGRPSRSPAASPASIARWCSYVLTERADRGRGPGRRRACLRGGAGPVPGRGRPVEPGASAVRMVILDLRAGRAEDAAAHLREALQIDRADRHLVMSCSTAWTAAGTCAPRPGAPPRPSRCGPRTPRSSRQRGTRIRPWTCAAGRNRCAQARQALGPGRARAAEERGAAMSLATAAEYALMLTDPGPRQPGAAGAGQAQRPGTGAGHPGRPGPHRRADRRRAVHQRPHRPLPPGPDPGQDRLPPPRRPDPPGPRCRTHLARPVARLSRPGSTRPVLRQSAGAWRRRHNCAGGLIRGREIGHGPARLGRRVGAPVADQQHHPRSRPPSNTCPRPPDPANSPSSATYWRRS